jgi:hypothetical protein
MPNWKKVIVSGSDAALNSLDVTTSVTASSLQVTGGIGNEGTFIWNSTDNTVDLQLNDVTLQLGQELVYHVVNQTGTQINNGEVVYAAGVSSDKLSVAPYSASLGVSPDLVLGVATENIPDTEFGFVTRLGMVRDVDTSGFAVGTPLYAATGSSGYTDIVPSPPDSTIFLGTVTKQDAVSGNITLKVNHLLNADEVKTNLSGSGLSSTNVEGALLELQANKVDVGALSSNIIIYPTTGSSPVSGYFRMVTDPDDPDYNTTAVDVSTGAISGSGQFIAALASDEGLFVGNPGIIAVSTVGNIRKTGGSGGAQFYYEVYLRDSGSVETLVATSDTTGVVDDSNYTEFNASAILNNGVWSTTDRVVVKYYANRDPGGSNPTYDFQFGGISPIRTLLPVPVSVIPSDDAVDIQTDTSNFNNILSGADADVQKALDTLDDHSHTLQQITDEGNITTDRIVVGNITADTDTLYTSGSRVGIGTTTPNFKLDVKSSTGDDGISISAPARKGIELLLDSGINGGGDIRMYSGVNVITNRFNAQGSSYINGGNVGIGTTAPSDLLTVNGNFGTYHSNYTTDAFRVTHNSNDVYLSLYKRHNQTTPEILLTSTDTNHILGDVGIGTTTPSSKLEVYGSGSTVLDIQGSQGQLFSVTDDLTGTLFTVSDISGIPIFEVDASGESTFDGDVLVDGNVGIGTTTPTGKLNVVDGTTSLYFSGSLGNGFRGLNLAGTNPSVRLDGGGDTFIISALNSSLSIWDETASTYRVNILNNGNVGIGTTSPTKKLHVNGEISGSDIYINDWGSVSASLSTHEGSISSLNGVTGSYLLNTTDTLDGDLTVTGTLTAQEFHTEFISSSIIYESGSTKFGDTVDDNHDFTGSLNLLGSAEITGDIQLVNKSDALIFGSAGSNGTWGAPKIGRIDSNLIISDYSGVQLGGYSGSAYGPRMTVKGTGNVGIGTTSPGYNLHIADTDATINLAKTDGDQYLRLVGGSGTNSDVIAQRTLTLQALSGNVLLQPTGNVGIGTTSPGYMLTVASDLGTGGTLAEFRNSNSTYQQNLYLSFNSSKDVTWSQGSSAGGSIFSTGTRGFSFQINTVDKVKIDSAGQLKLLDYGSGTFTGTATQRLAVDSSGNVIEIPIGSGPVDGSGTANYSARWTDADTIGIGSVYDDGTGIGIGTTTIYSNSVNLNNVGSLRIGNAEFISKDVNDMSLFQNKMRITSAGNVGIGTTSPSEKLEVSEGYILSSGASTSHGFELQRNGSDTYQLRHLDGGLTVFNSTDSRKEMTFDGVGNVGIGTTSPATKLDVSGEGTFSSYLNVNSSVGIRSTGWIHLHRYGSDTNVAVGNNGTNVNLFIPNGNVGIGTTSPDEKLDVAGNVKISGSLEFEGSGIGSLRAPDGLSEISLNVADINNGNNPDNFFIALDNSGEGSFYAKYLEFGDGEGVENQTKLTIDSLNSEFKFENGNVGIGTSSPSQKLEVNGNIQATGSRSISSLFDANNYISIESNSSGGVLKGTDGGVVTTLVRTYGDSYLNGGNVGIGTTNPGEKLSVNGKVLAGAFRTDVNTGDYSVISRSNAGNPALYVQSADNSANQPIAKFFYGNASPNQGSIVLNVAKDQSYFTNTNVGIGTINPTEKLDVDGNLKVSGTGTFGGKVTMADFDAKTNGTSAPRITSADGLGDVVLRFYTGTTYKGQIGWDESINEFGIYGDTSSGTPLMTFGSGQIKMRGVLNGNANSIINVNNLTATGAGTFGGLLTANSGATINSSSATPLTIGRTVANSNTSIYFKQNSFDSYIGVNTSGNLVFNTSADLTGSYKLKVDRLGNLDVNGSVAARGTGAGNGFLLHTNSGITVNSNLMQFWSGQSSGLSLHTNSTGDGSNERMRITSSGNVGIGTTSPSQKLEVSTTNYTVGKFNGNTDNGTGYVGAVVEIESNNNSRGRGVYLTHRDSTDTTASEWYAGLPYTGTGYTIGNAAWGTSVNSDTGPAVLAQSKFFIKKDGNVGIGTTDPSYKLSVSGGINAGGKITYSKSAGSLNTTGYAVAGLLASYNGQSACFTFTCFGHTGGYQKIVYSCWNAAGTWNTSKAIDEGTNDFDVVASANGSTITFTFKSTSGTKSYTPRVTVEAFGTAINSTYA